METGVLTEHFSSMEQRPEDRRVDLRPVQVRCRPRRRRITPTTLTPLRPLTDPNTTVYGPLRRTYSFRSLGFVVWKLDRASAAPSPTWSTPVQDLSARAVGLRVLTGQGAQIDTTTAGGRLVFGIFAALAEFERELIRERTLAGLTAARTPSLLRGCHRGHRIRPSTRVHETGSSPHVALPRYD